MALVSIALEDKKKQRRQGAKLLVILAFNSTSLGENNKDDDELSSAHRCCGSEALENIKLKVNVIVASVMLPQLFYKIRF